MRLRQKMGKVRDYLEEHKKEAPRIIAHAMPYFVLCWTAIGLLVGAGWVDLPARSQDLHRIAANQKQNMERIDRVANETQLLKEDGLVRGQQLENIEEKVDETRINVRDMNTKLDQLINRMITLPAHP